MKKLVIYFLLLSQAGFAQNVGIGTTSPLTKLHVSGSTGDLAIFSGGSQLYLTLAEGNNYRGYIGSFYGNAEDVDFGTYSTNPTGKLHLVTGSTPRLTVTPGGNIGIGLSNPEQPLSVLGGAVIDQTNLNTGTVANSLRFGSGSGETIGSRRTAGANQYGLDFYTQSLNRMTITNAGIVGIGTITPESSAILDINSVTKGVTNPRMTKSQREAIPNPATGLLVFDLVYKTIFLYDGTAWVPLAPGYPDDLSGGPQTPADNPANSRFGFSVSIETEWAIAGAPYQNTNVGAAYVYRLTNGDWLESAKLIPDDGTQQFFGASVSISYPYAIVGSPGHNAYTGCVYVFYHNGSSWAQVNKFFKPSGASPLDNFGYSVDIDGINFVVGCPGSDNSIANGGGVYAYRYASGSWSHFQTLGTGPLTLGANANLGYAVAIANNNIVAGAPNQNTTGKVLYYGLTGTWQHLQTLSPGYKEFIAHQDFGASVDINYNVSSDTKISVAVGAPATYFVEMNSGYQANNIGWVEAFWGSESSLVTGSTAIESGSVPPNGGTEGYKLGTSVSVYHFGLIDNHSSPFEIHIVAGEPNYNSNRGRASRLVAKKKFEVSENSFLNFYLTPGIPVFFTEKHYYTEKSNNALMGSAVNMFNIENILLGAPGKNNNKGTIVFGF